jgi:hypothetical protein
MPPPPQAAFNRRGSVAVFASRLVVVELGVYENLLEVPQHRLLAGDGSLGRYRDAAAWPARRCGQHPSLPNRLNSTSATGSAVDLGDARNSAWPQASP